jgi:vacuolar iron transporter family protein
MAHPDTHHHIRSPHAEEHRLHRTGWLRAAVLGANDGLVSTACLIVGVIGGGASASAVRTAGIAGLVAGALSMAVGEYVSVASQRDVEEADLRIERQALEDHPGAELAELAEIWRHRGLTPAVAEEVARQLTERDALEAHARDELGLTAIATARPLQAAGASAVAFSMGALVPLVGYLLSPDTGGSVVVFGVALVALLILGTISATLGGARRLRAATRVGIGGTVAMLITLGIGELTGAVLA